MERTGVAVLGATGSIGRSTLNVIRRHPERFRVVALTANENAAALARLAVEFDPDFVVLAGDSTDASADWDGEWLRGREGVVAAARADGADIVVNGLVGVAGLEPTLAALEAKRRLALANKESLVAGGELALKALRDGGELIPVDSEHSAVFQCLQGRPPEEIDRIVLTASGGPFRTWPAARFADIRPRDALAHPTWDMGDKITIDSATLANKALEVIEGHYLFGLDYDRIEVVVHPASVVHCLLEFRDGSTLAQLSLPTMELPVRYALFHPERQADTFERFDPVAASPLEFEPVRESDFPMFGLGVAAGRKGGSYPAAYNAANEVAVRAFLDGRLDFPGIARAVEAALEAASGEAIGQLADVWRVDAEARRATAEYIERAGSVGAGR
jgi:1-deoxy-D-xylulose-5-phosphate reductoisomerase